MIADDMSNYDEEGEVMIKFLEDEGLSMRIKSVVYSSKKITFKSDQFYLFSLK